MKYYETKFEEYITTINTYNLHPKITKELYKTGGSFGISKKGLQYQCLEVLSFITKFYKMNNNKQLGPKAPKGNKMRSSLEQDTRVGVSWENREQHIDWAES